MQENRLLMRVLPKSPASRLVISVKLGWWQRRLSLKQMSNNKPGIYIPTLYFAEGLPYAIVMMLSAVFFKILGASNIFIGLTTLLSLP